MANNLAVLQPMLYSLMNESLNEPPSIFSGINIPVLQTTAPTDTNPSAAAVAIIDNKIVG